MRRPWAPAAALLESSDQSLGATPQDAQSKARDHYLMVAAALKAEAGVREHIQHKKISGMAWFSAGRILAPAGITRRQLYVLAHECGHIVLHSAQDAWTKPNHIKEHEAETYAHRAFKAYGLAVPEKSAWWARAYVAQCIREDRAKGASICSMAEAFAAGTRSPYDPLPALDGNPYLSATVLGLQPAFVKPLVDSEETAMTSNPDNVPIGCGTCRYYKNSRCTVHLEMHYYAWPGACGHGRSWRPRPRPFFARLAEAILYRISEPGRVRGPEIATKAPEAPKNGIIKLESNGRTRS